LSKPVENPDGSATDAPQNLRASTYAKSDLPTWSAQHPYPEQLRELPPLSVETDKHADLGKATASERTVGKDETLSQIAQQMLGPQASTREIYAFVNIIARENHIENPNAVLAGKTIKIPEHITHLERTAKTKEGKEPAQSLPKDIAKTSEGKEPAKSKDSETKLAVEVKAPKPTEPKPIDMNAMEKDAEAIRKATGNDNLIFRHADRDA